MNLHKILVEYILIRKEETLRKPHFWQTKNNVDRRQSQINFVSRIFLKARINFDIKRDSVAFNRTIRLHVRHFFGRFTKSVLGKAGENGELLQKFEEILSRILEDRANGQFVIYRHPNRHVFLCRFNSILCRRVTINYVTLSNSREISFEPLGRILSIIVRENCILYS